MVGGVRFAALEHTPSGIGSRLTLGTGPLRAAWRQQTWRCQNIAGPQSLPSERAAPAQGGRPMRGIKGIRALITFWSASARCTPRNGWPNPLLAGPLRLETAMREADTSQHGKFFDTSPTPGASVGQPGYPGGGALGNTVVERTAPSHCAHRGQVDCACSGTAAACSNAAAFRRTAARRHAGELARPHHRRCARGLASRGLWPCNPPLSTSRALFYLS